MRCILTNTTIGMTSFSVGTNPTIGTDGQPSYHHEHQSSLFVSIGQPSKTTAVVTVISRLLPNALLVQQELVSHHKS